MHNIHTISKAIYYLFFCFLFRKDPLSTSRDTAILLWRWGQNLPIFAHHVHLFMCSPWFVYTGRSELRIGLFKFENFEDRLSPWLFILMTTRVLLPCISWPWVVSWPPSSYFEISINLKACIILEWSIIVRFIITTTFKTCATTHLSVWYI